MREIVQEGPVFVLVKEAAIEQVNEETYVADPNSIIVGRLVEHGKVLDEEGCLLFTRRQYAERCRAKLRRTDCMIATFLNPEHFQNCMRDFQRRGFRFVAFNRNSGMENDRTTTIQEAIEVVAT